MYSYISSGRIRACAAMAALLVSLWAQPANADPTGILIFWGGNGFGVVSGTPAGMFQAVDAGVNHSVAIRDDGTLISWGDNGSGQVSGTPAGMFQAVAAGSFQSVAIRDDGTLISWGNNRFGQAAERLQGCSKQSTPGTLTASRSRRRCHP